MCIYSLKYSNIEGSINSTFKYIQFFNSIINIKKNSCEIRSNTCRILCRNIHVEFLPYMAITESPSWNSAQNSADSITSK